MADLIEIIRDNFESIKEDPKGTFKGIIKGIISGTYLPVAGTSSLEQIEKEFSLEGDITLAESTAAIYTGPLSAIAIYSPIMAYAMDNGLLPEAIGALAVTNIVDYIANKCKRE